MFYLALLFLVAGLWLVIAFFLEVLRSRRYRSYPLADGFITKLDLRERKGRNKTWNPNIEYTYQVNEQTYTGNRLTFSRVVVDITTEGKIRQLFAVGNPVKVYYNPRKPGDSVLNPGGADLKIRLTVGIVCLLIGLGIFLVQMSPK